MLNRFVCSEPPPYRISSPRSQASQISKQAILPTSHNSAPMVGSSPILAVLSRKWADCVCIMTTLPHNPYW